MVKRKSTDFMYPFDNPDFIDAMAELDKEFPGVGVEYIEPEKLSPFIKLSSSFIFKIEFLILFISLMLTAILPLSSFIPMLVIAVPNIIFGIFFVIEIYHEK